MTSLLPTENLTGWSAGRQDELSAKSNCSAMTVTGVAAVANPAHYAGLVDELRQTQAMPGFTNVLLISFPKPGTYTLHCDELCGPGHPFMKGTITVGGCGGAAGAGAGCSTGCA